MFYSKDLLCVRGGKFSTIWLVATSKDKNAVIKKKKSDLLKTNMAQLCHEISAMLPVRGKERSFSLRTSSILVCGTCITLRVMAEDLRRSVLLLLSKKPVVTSEAIDLPGGQGPNQLVGLDVPFDDYDMGNIEANLLEPLFDMNFRVRMEDITIKEQDQPMLNYEGPDVPILTERDILDQMWDLEEVSTQVAVDEVEKGHQSGKRQLGDVGQEQSPKRLRVGDLSDAGIQSFGDLGQFVNEERCGTEEVHDVERSIKEADLPYVHNVPTIVIIPAEPDDTQGEALPEQVEKSLQMEVPGIPPTTVLEDTITNLPALEDTITNIPAPEDSIADVPAPEVDSPIYLEPLVPVLKKPKPAKKGISGLLWVDLETQLSGVRIKKGLGKYEDTMRCKDVAMDFAKKGRAVDFSLPGRKLGKALSAMYDEDVKQIRLDKGNLLWDWEDVDEGTNVCFHQVQDQGNLEVEQRKAAEEIVRPVDAEEEMQLEAERDQSRNVSMDTSLVSVPAESTGRKSRSVIEEGVAMEQEQYADVQVPQDADLSLETNFQEVSRDLLPIPEVDERSDGLLPIPEVEESREVEKAMNEDVNIAEVPTDGASFPQVAAEPTVNEEEVHTKVNEQVGSGLCTFTTLCPTDSTSRKGAALSFFHLLKLEKEGIIKTSQDEAFGEIKIFKSV